MKIFFLNHDLSPYTGAGRFFIFLTSTLKHLMPDVSIKVATSEDLISPNKLRLLFNLPKILGLARSSELIHALDGWPYGFLGALCGWLLGKKLVITAVGTGGVKPLYNFWQKPLLRWAYHRADKLVAVSRHTRDEILKVVPSLNIEVINHGVDVGKYQVSSIKYSVSGQIKPYILSVGAWKRRKGFEHSIAAFDLLKKQHPNLSYAILCNPSAEIKAKYPQVSFVGGFSESALVTLYKNAELFILLPQDDNKDIEGFGLIYLEAAAAGLPVIGAKSTSAEDAVLEGKNGILVDGQNPEEAAWAMEKILSNPELRDRMSKESLEFAKLMTWEKAAEAYKKVYASI
ncbi:MAG: glycosyltransferase family 4 protein [Patescibacteria group bacterium]